MSKHDMKYRYYICDVFTDQRFGGNQLAVLPDAQGLTDRQMQQIAREFNFSESSFVFPPEHGNTRKVRIFTPSVEVPFAGHPNIGTAFVLASIGEPNAFAHASEMLFEEKAGLVRISLGRLDSGALWCELEAPQEIAVGASVSAETLASAVSLAPGDIVTDTHLPRVASVGLPFLVAQLRDRSALARAKVNLDGLQAIAAQGITPDVHLYVHSSDEFAIRARMFAPFDGVPEDPATGSANCALAGLLAHCSEPRSGDFQWRIAQGVEMGRPSRLTARAKKMDGKVIATWIGGRSVMVSEGTIYID